MSHLLLIDASGFAYRAFHAIPPRQRADGMPTHAIIGFMSLLSRMIDRASKDPYDFAAAVFDAPGQTFRHKLYQKYKGGRTRPDDLNRQLPILREAAHVMGFEPIEMSGYEADDLIATLATIALESKIRTTIVSVDKDFFQLVKDGEIEIANPVNRSRVCEADVVKKFGVEPHLVPDVQALCGDAVDNIPGVPGVGMQKAAGLIRRFGSLAAVGKAIDKPQEHFAPLTRAALKSEQNNFALYRKLVTLKRNVPWPGDISTLRPHLVREDAVRDMLRLLEAEPLYEVMFGNGGGNPIRVVDAHKDPYGWWREELLARGQPITELPQCGFFQRRLHRHGPIVVARIWREPELDFLTEKPTGNDILRCQVGGRDRDPYAEWGYLCSAPISTSDYKKRSGKPAQPTSEPVDFTTLPPPTFGKRRKNR